MNNALIVDDNLSNLANNLSNAIPVLPFRGSSSDDELVKLLKYLISIRDKNRLVEANKGYFMLERWRISRNSDDACTKYF